MLKVSFGFGVKHFHFGVRSNMACDWLRTHFPLNIREEVNDPKTQHMV
jgi:hypothetical protein